ncbi:MAG: RluA family pseudouridine synthase [Rhodopirellula sp.]|nr:RluA family pseudouridine synthase [Rhodopirellula sp.]
MPNRNSIPLPVLYEDNHLLAVIKPAGVPTMGVSDDRISVLALAKQYVKEKYCKPGNVYLGIVSRLDAPVTGVVLLARTSKAARRLTEQFRTRLVEKVYWTLVEGALQRKTDQWIDWVDQDPRHRRMHIVGRTIASAKEARLTYRLLRALDDLSLVEVTLDTGRKHQIRLQMSHHGHPVLGDRKYGSRFAFPAGIALHARRLVVAHPINGEPVRLEAPLPDSWKGYTKQ